VNQPRPLAQAIAEGNVIVMVGGVVVYVTDSEGRRTHYLH